MTTEEVAMADDLTRASSVGRWFFQREASLKDHLWPEVAFGLAGSGGAVALLGSTHRADRVSIAGDGLMTLGVLLGVVFAAFALLIALLDSTYVQLLNRTKSGVSNFMLPFLFALGCEIFTIILSIVYRASAEHLAKPLEAVLFPVWAFAFVYTLIDVYSLGKSVLIHGLHRAELIDVLAEDDDDTSVTPIKRKGTGG